jgi:hypothetical protein
MNYKWNLGGIPLDTLQTSYLFEFGRHRRTRPSSLCTSADISMSMHVPQALGGRGQTRGAAARAMRGDASNRVVLGWLGMLFNLFNPIFSFLIDGLILLVSH